MRGHWARTNLFAKDSVVGESTCATVDLVVEGRYKKRLALNFVDVSIDRIVSPRDTNCDQN